MVVLILIVIFLVCVCFGELEMYWVIEGLDELMRDKEYIMKKSLV